LNLSATSGTSTHVFCEVHQNSASKGAPLPVSSVSLLEASFSPPYRLTLLFFSTFRHCAM
jgi:hypothetical protein